MKPVLPTFLFCLASIAATSDLSAQDVRVTRIDGATERGSLLTLTDSEVVLRIKEQPGRTGLVKPDRQVLIQLEEIRKIEKVPHGLRNGLLGGAAAGALSGLLLEANLNNTDAEVFGLVALIFGAVGAGVGAGAGAVYDAVQRERRLLYVAPGARPVSVRPIVGPTHQGVQLAVRW
jgi:hypothetical protein